MRFLCTIRYDTVDLRALKKNRNQKPSSSEETVQAKVRGGSPGGRSETKRGRICERGRF